jgi:flagellar biosynthesis protein FliR
VLPADLQRHISLLGFAMLRAAPLVWLIPAFGGPSVSLQLRLLLAIALSGLCLPILSSQAPLAVSLWTVFAVREVLVGVAIGFICACWFRAVEAAGGIIEAVSGTSAVRGSSPVGTGAAGPFSSLMLPLAIVIFFEIGGVGHVVLALARSYEAIPVSSTLSLGTAGRSATVAAILASAKLIESALGLCAPVLVALLLAELALGLIGRVIPQLPITAWGAPLKPLLGAGVLLLGLGALQAAMQASFAEFLALVRSATGALR